VPRRGIFYGPTGHALLRPRRVAHAPVATGRGIRPIQWPWPTSSRRGAAPAPAARCL